MGDNNQKRTVIFLVILLIVFAIIFFLAFAGLQRKEALFGIGVPPVFENWMIMILSVGAIIKIIWELITLKK